MTCETNTEQICSIKNKVWCASTTATTGYSKGDGCMLLGCDGLDASTVVCSLTDEPNNDRPIDGVRKSPATWRMKTLCEMMCAEEKQDVYVTDFTINGDTATVTRSDGTSFTQTITHPSGVNVTNFEINGDEVTVTMSDGTTFTQTVTHPSGDPEKYIVDAVIDSAAGAITYTYNDGTSFNKPHPADASDPSITDLTKTVDFTGPTSDLVVESSDGTNTAPFSLTDPRLFPSANFKYVPAVVGTNTDVTGVEKPVASLKKVILKGGFILGGVGDAEFVIPRDGMYDVTFASNAYWNAEDGSEPRAMGTFSDGAGDISGFRMNLNGNPIDGFGTPEWGFVRTGNYHYKTMRIEFEAKAGDLVSAETYLDPNLIMKVHQGPIKGTIKRISDI